MVGLVEARSVTDHHERNRFSGEREKWDILRLQAKYNGRKSLQLLHCPLRVGIRERETGGGGGGGGGGRQTETVVICYLYTQHEPRLGLAVTKIVFTRQKSKIGWGG